jgi:hypothetical protein
MPPAGKDEKLAFGYLFLLQQLLEHLRYRTRSSPKSPVVPSLVSIRSHAFKFGYGRRAAPPTA